MRNKNINTVKESVGPGRDGSFGTVSPLPVGGPELGVLVEAGNKHENTKASKGRPSCRDGALGVFAV